MSHHAHPPAAHGDRRKATRHYLTRPMRAELVWGRQRFAVESGAISNISEVGLSLRLQRYMKMPPQGQVTIAVPYHDRVLTLAGRIASLHSGGELGFTLEGGGNPLFAMLGRELDGASVSPPQNGKAHVAGNLTMAARHPVKWAIDAGATRLDMSGVTALDASAIGMLLKFGERHGIRLGDCSSCVCQLVSACAAPALCAVDCKKAPA